MSYGMQISASGALASMHRQDALTANLANVNTVGFKPVFAETMHRAAARHEDSLWNLPGDALLERLGAGVFAAPTTIDFGQGALETSDNDLDLAILGPGFFTVGDPSNPVLTRDGRLTMNAQGVLVMATTGLPVLDEQGRPITLDPTGGPVSVGADGLLAQDGVPIARIRVAEVPDLDALVKVGQGLFALASGQPPTLLPALGRVRQHATEQSGVNEIDAMMGITSASKAAQSNLGMIDMQNRLLDRLVNTFGRIA